METTIKKSSKEKVGILSTKLNAVVFEVIRNMPGKKKWDGPNLLFEMTRANIEFLRENFPDADWQFGQNRVDEIMNLIEEEAVALQNRMTKPALPPEGMHFRFKTEPKAHQLEAFHEVKDKMYFGLFWEQGLGKTKEIFDVAAYKWSTGEINTLFIMAPNGVHVQWVHEQLAVHLPDWVPFRQVIWQTEHTKKWQAQVDVVLGYNDGLRIVAMNHESIITKNGTQFAMRVLNSGKCFWVFDESNAYAKFSASRTKVALKLRDNATCRSILTGTPVGLGIEDLYTQLALLHPDILGFDSFYTFRNHFCEVEQVYGAPAGVKEITGYKNVNELQKKLHAHCIRKTAAECLDLPERTYSTRNVEMTAQQRKAYNDMLDDMLTELDNGAIVTAEQAIVRLMRLQQIVSGFIRDDEGVIHDIPNNRVQAAVDWAGQCNSKMVIWARFHRDIDNLRAAFAKMKPAWWDGRNTSTRAEEKQRFIEDPGCRVFIANQGAAGTGVDGLQYVSHEMLYYSNSFKAIERWQSEARLYRMGQAGTVSVTDLVARNTTDLKLRAVLKKRKATADMVLDTPISEILDPHGINAKEEVFNFIRDLAREDTVDDFLAAK